MPYMLQVKEDIKLFKFQLLNLLVDGIVELLRFIIVCRSIIIEMLIIIILTAMFFKFVKSLISRHRRTWCHF